MAIRLSPGHRENYCPKLVYIFRTASISHAAGVDPRVNVASFLLDGQSSGHHVNANAPRSAWRRQGLALTEDNSRPGPDSDTREPRAEHAVEAQRRTLHDVASARVAELFVKTEHPGFHVPVVNTVGEYTRAHKELYKLVGADNLRKSA